MNEYLVFLLAMSFLFIFMFILKSNSRKMAASFSMYAARDQFVLLVANDVLKESDPVFRHYYERINIILSDKKSVGIDSLIKRMLGSRSKLTLMDFDAAIKEAKKRADEVNKSPSMQKPEVKEAVKLYFDASKEMILTQSNLLKLFYILCVRRKELKGILEAIAPSNYKRATSVVVDFNDAEINCLAA